MQSLTIGVLRQSPAIKAQRHSLYKAVQGFVHIGSAAGRIVKVAATIRALPPPYCRNLLPGRAILSASVAF